MRENITPLVESGLLTATAVVLGLASIYLPILGVFVEFFLAVPIAVLTVRQGAAKGAMSIAATFLLTAMFAGPLLSARIALSFGVCGYVLGVCVRKNFGAVRCFVSTLVAALVAQTVAIFLVTMAMGINVAEIQVNFMRETFETTMGIYEDLGLSQAELDAARAQIEPTLKLLGYLMPTMLMLMALINTLACYWTSRLIFDKLRMDLPKLPPFAAWKFPQTVAFVAAFAMIGIYWGGTREWTIIYEISLNAMFAAMTIGFLQGLSLLSFLADRYGISKLVRRVFTVFLILNVMMMQIVAFAGLFDMLFDYRKKIQTG